VILALHMVGCMQPLVFLHQVPTATRTMIHTHFVSHSHQQDSCLPTTKFTHEYEAAYAFKKENCTTNASKSAPTHVVFKTLR
jgi:hypothetical protein